MLETTTNQPTSLSQLAIDVRTLVQSMSPFHEFVDQHPAVSHYLAAPATYYERAFQGGERNIEVLKLLNKADAVSLEVRRRMATRRPCWPLLDRELYAFLAHCAPAARTLIPQVLDQIQHKLLQNEWYELMGPYRQVRVHVEQKISIQHYPRKKA